MDQTLIVLQELVYYCVEIRLVLSMSRFYCEEQSLEGIICWLVDTFVVYCIHVKHTFEESILHSKHMYNIMQMHKVQVLLNCGLHLD